MTVFYLKQIWNEIKRKFIIVAGIVTILGGIMAYFSYKSVEPAPKEDPAVAEIYEKTLSEYDIAMTDLQSSIQTTETQIEELQRYCNDSVYMKLDSQNIYIYGGKYSTGTLENAGSVLNAMVSYVKEGSFVDEVAEKYSEIPVSYMREVISFTTEGTMLTVTMKHFDPEAAEKILGIMDEVLVGHVKELESKFGAIEWKKQEKLNFTTVDTSVMNTQLSHLSNLKSYQNSLADLKSKAISQKNVKQDYIRRHEEAQAEKQQVQKPVSRKRRFAAGGLIGALLGFICCIVFFLLKLMIDDQIKEKRELRFFGLPLLGQVFNKKDGLNEDTKDCITVLCSHMAVESLFLCALDDEEDTGELLRNCKVALESESLKVDVGITIGASTEEVKKMLRMGNCIFMIREQKTTYPKMREQLNICEKLNIPVWGAIFVENSY
jgi:capsular polysaccharide biosynthesis protein